MGGIAPLNVQYSSTKNTQSNFVLGGGVMYKKLIFLVFLVLNICKTESRVPSILPGRSSKNNRSSMQRYIFYSIDHLSNFQICLTSNKKNKNTMENNNSNEEHQVHGEDNALTTNDQEQQQMEMNSSLNMQHQLLEFATIVEEKQNIVEESARIIVDSSDSNESKENQAQERFDCCFCDRKNMRLHAYNKHAQLHLKISKEVKDKARYAEFEKEQKKFLRNSGFGHAFDPYRLCYKCEKWVPARDLGYCPVCFTLI